MSAGFRAGTSNDGYLQINGTDILTVSSGVLGVKNTGAQSEMRLYCESNNAHYASLKSPPHSDFIGNVTFTLPGTSGNNGQVLQTDGSGNLSWVNNSGSGGGGGASDKLSEGNTEAEVVDTGSDGHFKVTTEGDERFRVDSDGNSKFISNARQIILRNDGTAGLPKIDFRNSADTGNAFGFINGATLDLQTGGTTRLQIDSSGEIVSHNGTLRRDVSNSSFTVTGDTASNTGSNINLYGASHSSLANIFRVRTGATERLRVGPSGQIGLGGANYGTSGQVLTSGGASGAVSWTTISGAGGSYGNSDVDNHLNSGAASSGQILSWNGSDYAWVADQGGSGGGGISDLVDDTTPQLGGNLDLNSNNITGTGDINITGDLDITGDVEIDTLTASGICTFNNFLRLPGGTSANNQIQLGNSQEFTFQYNTSSTKGIIQATGNDIDIRATTIRLQPNGGENGINVNLNGSVELYHDNAKKLETTSTGATVTGTLTATTFSGSGASLTTLNASELDSGTIPDARFPATLPAISGANLTNLPSDTPADTDVQVTYDLGANGSSAYLFTGPGYSGADDNPDLYLVRGQRYRFINATGGHPFRIQSNTSGTAYTDGVSGSQSGTQDFNVQHNAPERLYYQCTSHPAMIGNIYIVGASDWRMTDVATSATPEIYTDRDVSIGTTNPGNANLAVVSATQAAFSIGQNTDGSGQDHLGIYYADAGSGGADIFTSNGDMSFWVDGAGGSGSSIEFGKGFGAAAAGANWMNIDSSGRLLKSGQASLTSTSLNHPIQVAAASDANAIAIIGRASDDIGELSFYEADKSTKLGELQYRPDHLNLRHRVGDIRFATGGTTERLRIDSAGRIATNGRAPSSYNNPAFLISGDNATLTIMGDGSNNNSSIAAIKFRVAGTSTGDYTKAAIFAKRMGGYNDLDMIFALDTAADANGVNLANEKLRIKSGGNVELNSGHIIMPAGYGVHFGASTGSGSTSTVLDDYEEGTWTVADAEGSNGLTSNVAWYVKIGSLVHIRASINVGSSSSNSRISLTLPFNSNNSAYYAGEGYTGYSSYTGSTPRPVVENGGTRLYFYDENSTNLMTWANFSGKRIDFSVRYQRT